MPVVYMSPNPYEHARCGWQSEFLSVRQCDQRDDDGRQGTGCKRVTTEGGIGLDAIATDHRPPADGPIV